MAILAQVHLMGTTVTTTQATYTFVISTGTNLSTVQVNGSAGVGVGNFTGERRECSVNLRNLYPVEERPQRRTMARTTPNRNSACASRNSGMLHRRTIPAIRSA